MSRRKWILLAVLTLIVAVAAEMTLKSSKTSRGCVRIVNQSDEAMEDLVARYDGSNIALGRLAKGESVNVWFTAGAPGVLSIDFDQLNNPLAGFQIPDYDPGQNRRDGFKLCLTVTKNILERSVEDDETMTPFQTLFERVKDWIKADLTSQPAVSRQ